MDLDSYAYAYFVLGVVVLVRLARSGGRQQAALAAANLAFLVFLAPALAALLLGLNLATFFLVKALASARRARTAVLVSGCALLLGGLVAGRYLAVPEHFSVPLPQFASRPAALSFSFALLPLLALLLDVGSGKLPAPGFLRFLSFAGFFPVLQSGPVLRPGSFFASLEAAAGPDPARVRVAFERISYGLFKKFVLADRLGLLFHELEAQARGGRPAVAFALFYVYAVEVYFDFSGYSDLAIGIARALGIALPENFRAPYLAESPVDWWRRWHISLAEFLRDYVYYPLFFRTKNIPFCIAVTFVLNGLWHGLAWNYAGLGLYWTGAILLYLAMQRTWDEAFPRWLRIALTLQIAAGSFIFFLPDGWALLRLGLSAGAGAADAPALDRVNLLILGAGIALAWLRPHWRPGMRAYLPRLGTMWVFTFVFGLFSMKSFFIYSQF